MQDRFAPPPMPKSKKILIGVLSILPSFLFASYFVFIIGMMFVSISSAPDPKAYERIENYMSYMPLVVALAVLGGILTIAMTIYHIIHISKSTTMSSNDKLIWILIVLILNWIGDIIYWYMKIWKEPKTDPNKSSFY